MKRVLSLVGWIAGAFMAFPAAAALADDRTPPAAASPAAASEQPRCSEPGYWPLPGSGGCLKIDGSGNLEQGVAPSTLIGLGDRGEGALPDLSAAFKVSRSWGSVQLSGVAGGVDVLSAATDERILGWGISAGGAINLPTGEGADQIGVNLQYGDGAQRYLLGEGIKVGDVYNNLPVPGTAETLQSVGGSVWVQHWWSDTIRSNLVGGVVHTDIPPSVAALSPSMAERTWYGAANVVWSPMSQLNLGLEVIYGRSDTIGNATTPQADEDLFRVQASVQRTF